MRYFELITLLVLSALVCIPIGAAAQVPEISTPMLLRGLRDAVPVQTQAVGKSRHLPITRPSFDVANLPPIESIGGGSEIRPFLAFGVPADMTRAALRRAWLTDPAIRDFIGLSENSWDFNSPGDGSRFGSLTALTDEAPRAGSSAQVK